MNIHQHSQNVLSDEDRLQMVSQSISELNNSIPNEKKIRMILFLWSKFSPKCSELIQSIPPECKRFFHFINIDSKSVRENILKSSSVSITKVPCVLVVHIDGLISTYEGESTIEIIKNIYSISQQIVAPKNPTGATPLSQILKGPNRIPPQNIVYENIEDDDEEPHRRIKIRRAERPMEDNSIGISSIRAHIPKGVGHDKLSMSSLNEIETPSASKFGAIDDGEELEEMDDIGENDGNDGMDELNEEDEGEEDDIQNLEDIEEVAKKKVKGPPIGHKKEAMENVKNRAEKMMKMREMEDESIKKRRP